MSICDSYSFKNNKNLNCFKMILKGITFPQINFKILNESLVQYEFRNKNISNVTTITF